jgi:hypothetical protein
VGKGGSGGGVAATATAVGWLISAWSWPFPAQSQPATADAAHACCSPWGFHVPSPTAVLYCIVGIAPARSLFPGPSSSRRSRSGFPPSASAGNGSVAVPMLGSCWHTCANMCSADIGTYIYSNTFDLRNLFLFKRPKATRRAACGLSRAALCLPAAACLLPAFVM